jgi:hypothetical protein
MTTIQAKNDKSYFEKMAQIPKAFENDTASSTQNSTSLFADLGRDICAILSSFWIKIYF